MSLQYRLLTRAAPCAAHLLVSSARWYAAGEVAAYCTNCGERLDGQALFCTGCGQKVEQDAPFTPASVPPPLPGTRVMSAAQPVPPRAKSSGSKILIWLGLLLFLLAVTVGLAYVAFKRFVSGGTAAIVQTEETFAAPEPTLEPEPPETPLTAEVEQIPQRVEPPPRSEPPPVPAPIRMPAPTPARVRTPAPDPAPPQPPPKDIPPTAPPSFKAGTVLIPTPPPAEQPAKSAPPEAPPQPKGAKVMLSGADAYAPPPAPEPTLPSAGGAPAPPPAPTSGDVFWTGTLQKNQMVIVDFSEGQGSVGGQPLPGKPVKLESFSPVIQIVELPGPENGWKRFAFKATRDAKRSVTLNFHWSMAQ